jgi:copper homeostasis protein
MRPLLLEVIVQTVADAVEAARGGADRLEVVRAIRLGGLTPPVSLVREIATATALPLRVMVRDDAGYSLDPRSLPALRRHAIDLAAAGVDGLVVGFTGDGEPLVAELERVLEVVPDVPVTFHRAFDRVRDPLSAIARLTAVASVDRILTSGGTGAPAERAERFHRYSARAGRRLTIIAGGGVDREAIGVFARTGCVREVHVGRAAREGGVPDGPVDAALVRRLRQAADGAA